MFRNKCKAWQIIIRKRKAWKLGVRSTCFMYVTPFVSVFSIFTEEEHRTSKSAVQMPIRSIKMILFILLPYLANANVLGKCFLSLSSCAFPTFQVDVFFLS